MFGVLLEGLKKLFEEDLLEKRSLERYWSFGINSRGASYFTAVFVVVLGYRDVSVTDVLISSAL
jgi:hypothetical protein